MSQELDEETEIKVREINSEIISLERRIKELKDEREMILDTNARRP